MFYLNYGEIETEDRVGLDTCIAYKNPYDFYDAGLLLPMTFMVRTRMPQFTDQTSMHRDFDDRHRLSWPLYSRCRA